MNLDFKNHSAGGKEDLDSTSVKHDPYILISDHSTPSLLAINKARVVHFLIKEIYLSELMIHAVVYLNAVLVCPYLNLVTSPDLRQGVLHYERIQRLPTKLITVLSSLLFEKPCVCGFWNFRS